MDTKVQQSSFSLIWVLRFEWEFKTIGVTANIKHVAVEVFLRSRAENLSDIVVISPITNHITFICVINDMAVVVAWVYRSFMHIFNDTSYSRGIKGGCIATISTTRHITLYIDQILRDRSAQRMSSRCSVIVFEVLKRSIYANVFIISQFRHCRLSEI